jgi:hypothetical protein
MLGASDCTIIEKSGMRSRIIETGIAIGASVGKDVGPTGSQQTKFHILNLCDIPVHSFRR